MGLQSGSMHAHTSQNRSWEISIIMSEPITNQLGRSSHQTDWEQVKKPVRPKIGELRPHKLDSLPFRSSELAE